ncbi:MAG TPA: hypothetical protein VH113_12450 [Gemmatimonadales bacterium]|jgi:fluoride ion exporter CrcB/FEX|nr:hypothetical protein [Gemmatimonadales bacterium]
MDRHRRLLWVWTGAACATTVAAFVATQWPDQWPALFAVGLFLVAALGALALSLAGASPSR